MHKWHELRTRVHPLELEAAPEVGQKKSHGIQTDTTGSDIAIVFVVDTAQQLLHENEALPKDLSECRSPFSEESLKREEDVRFSLGFLTSLC